MRILQISYYFPPLGGAGVQRGLKFAKYLPQFGVQPVVLSALDAHYVQDASLLAEVPVGLAVHRVPHTPLLVRIAAQRRAVAAAAPAPAQAAAGASAAPSVASAAGGATAADVASTPSTARWRDAALRSIRALQMPDDAAPWARRALAVARRIVRDAAAQGRPIELVFSSAPPASAHALGERIAHDFALPWVADFRDLWTDNPAYTAPAWRRALDRRREDRWLQRASGIVTVTPSWRELLAARCGPGTPVAFIPNGYDEDDFAALDAGAASPASTAARPATAAFTLVHTGTFYGPRDPAGLLDGLARYLAAADGKAPALRVRLVGNMGARFAAALQAFERRHPGVVQTLPYLPHRQALAELMAADALLLVVGGGHGPAVRGWLPGKIFEYLRSGLPVLLLGDPQGDAAQLIRQHGHGWVVDGNDAAGIAQALAQMVAGGAAAVAGSASPHVFERRELSRQLTDFLRHCQGRHAAAAKP